MGLSALFVLLPVNTDGEVHSTLVYMGEPEQAPPMEQCTEIARMLARSLSKPMGYVIKHDLFGDDDEQVKVAVLDGVDLYAIHLAVENYANSKWGYMPHISEQPGYPLPEPGAEIIFDRIGVWFGDQRITYRFGSGVQSAT